MKKLCRIPWGLFLTIAFTLDPAACQTNRAPVFQPGGDLTGFKITENTPVGTSVYTLRAEDPEGSTVLYGVGTDLLQVDSTSGEVTVRRLIDYESSPFFKVDIIASDGTSQTNLQVPIQVIDQNDEPPLFTQDIYKKTIPENTRVGTTIYPDLSVTDRDSVNRGIQVRCAAEKIGDKTTCDKFGLETIEASNLAWSGVLVLRQPVDYETQQSYQVPLQSFDGNPDNNVTKSIEITIEDIQDTPPKWISAPSQSIREGVPINFTVTTVLAIDGDEGEKRPIRYEIYRSSAPGPAYFTINDQSGVISTAREIDRESGDFNQGFVILSLRARELINATTVPRLGDGPSTTAVTTVRITIEDINDNPPTFDQSSYTVSIPEDIPTGTALPGLIMTVTDSDSLYLFEVGAGTSYAFTLMNHTDEFEVFPGEGQGTSTISMKVRNTNLIDYERGPRRYVMMIVAWERGTRELFSSTATVTVLVTDVNDNAPAFPQRSYTQYVREDAVQNTFIISVKATDGDTTDSFGTPSITYSLTGTFSGLFQIDPGTGDVVVSYCSTPGYRPCIDYEQVKFYELVVTARDEYGRGQAIPVSLRIIVRDVNDNTPRFYISNYGSTILERKVLPDPPVTVQAIDADENSTLRYSIIDQDGTPGLFQINPVSGNITATRPVLFSDTKPNTAEIQIRVMGSDGKFNATAFVRITVIDLNDGPPRFISNIYRASLPETTTGIVPVTSVSAIDPDSDTTGAGQVYYTIESGDQDKFRMDPTSGDVTTSTDATFNFDNQNEYRMLIKARDNGNPQQTGTATVIVSITDRNNRKPYFQPANLRASVYENVPVGYTVTTIAGKDPDVGKVLNYFFGTDKKAYSPIGGEVNITSYDFTNLFSVDRVSGIIRTNRELSRDQTSLVAYPIIVVDTNATDQSGTGTLIIDILDVNDKAPIFKPPWNETHPYYSQDLDEERTPGTFVRVMVATDPDGAIERYEIVQNPGQYFRINDQTGEVTVNGRLDFDYDKVDPQPKVYSFTVRAYDNGLPQLSADAHVSINLLNINDNNPKFEKGAYVVDDLKESGSPGGSNPGDFVVQVSATDLDAGDFGDVYYALRPGEDRFSINSTSGRVILLATDIDRETISDITFQVLAYDSANNEVLRRTSSVPVYVTVTDINDNPPIFTKEIYTRTIPEIFDDKQSVLQLSATDADVNDIGRLRFGFLNTTKQELFYIGDAREGLVQPIHSLQNRAGTYDIPVIVMDNEGRHPYNNDTAIVRIVVEAVTNHPPIWVIPPRDNMTIYVLEEQYLGLIVYDVEARDEDSGENAIVDYGFELANNQNATKTDEFRINSITGVIRAERVFDREEKDRYTLVLVARDGGGLRNTNFLTVVIKDVNDHLPRFSPREYSFTILENTEPGRLPFILTATDEDSEYFAKIVYYTIIAGNEDGVFSIGKTNGVLSLNKKLDAEKKRQYVLEVEGRNNVSDYSVISKRALPQNIATVYIQVGDVNDNAPQFTPTNAYFSCVSTGASLSSTILKVTAVDVDSLDVLAYTISDTSTENLFTIRNTTGVISNTVLMGNLGGKTFNLKVTASDRSNVASGNVDLFVTEPSNEAMIVLAQPPAEVRNIIPDLERQLGALLTTNNGNTDTRVCISRVENHVNDDGSINTAWSDVYLTGLFAASGTPIQYNAFSASVLVTRIQTIVSDARNQDELSIFYVRQIMAQSGAAEVISTPVLIVMILIIVLIILGLLIFLCFCCFCVRNKNAKDRRRLLAGPVPQSGYAIEEHQSRMLVTDAPVAPVVYNTGYHQQQQQGFINQGFDNQGFVEERHTVVQTTAHDPVYATVQKKSHLETLETAERLEAEQHQQQAINQMDMALSEEHATASRITDEIIITEPVDAPTRDNNEVIITETVTAPTRVMDEIIITEPVPVGEGAFETQGIEVEIRDSHHSSPTNSRHGHGGSIQHYEQEVHTSTTVM